MTATWEELEDVGASGMSITVMASAWKAVEADWALVTKLPTHSAGRFPGKGRERERVHEKPVTCTVPSEGTFNQ
jgi:hypothetical protein